jgi:PhnB protein
MGCDVPESFGNSVIGTNFNVSITAESKEEADKLFNALSEGGKTTMAMQDAFWGSYFGMLTDRFDIQWMISYDTNLPPQ